MPVPRRNAAPNSVTAADLVWCGAAKPPWRHNWAKRNRLRAEPPFGIHDASETAIAWHLVGVVGGKRATQVWDVIRPALRQLLLRTDDVWVVVATSGPRHAVAEGPADAAVAGAALGVACWLLPVEPTITRAKERYGEVLSGHTVTGGGVAHIRDRAARP